MIAALRNQTLSAFASPHAAAGLALVSLTAALVLMAGRLGPHPSLLQGWLLAFAIWSCAPVGSVTLLLIHRLTGGRWGVVAGAILRPLAATMPLVAIAFVPVLAGLTYIYPWAADASQIKPDIARWYLDQPWFVLRAVIALIGWSVLGVTFALGLGGRLLAALGLAFYGFTISMVAVDWFLSLEPHYVSTAFGSMIAIQQLLAALAVVAVLATTNFERRALSDIASLLIATVLGVVYLEYMTYVVAWYGDLPEKAEWFLRRSKDAWVGVLLVTFVAGAVLPFSMLLFEGLRRSRSGLRIVGLLLLFGTVMHFVWLMMPAFSAQAPAALTALGTLLTLTIASVLFGQGIASVEVHHAE
ncbi:hypothetical protein [Bradyrhizobium sp. 192]|uniref:hypothetical protein n=1 Tax=Bradyrhizobium sp. 192 TaxID=2782660 RepID=UPI001FFFA6D8|nr:hypothetical protein [Bradyrhizobium sp. 192]UPJ56910.1 hypothetical protein IVB24_30660 [Bradyrhizobium sp. 192]